MLKATNNYPEAISRLKKIEAAYDKLQKTMKDLDFEVSSNFNVNVKDIQNIEPDFRSSVENVFSSINVAPLEQEISAALDQQLQALGLIDTGALKSSVTLTFSGNQFDISYSSPYAALMHDGGYILPYGNPTAKPVYIPPRPWIANALESIDFESRLVDLLGA